LTPGQRAIGTQTDQLDAVLDHARLPEDHIAMAVSRLERARMIFDAEALTAELLPDLIDPGDFCR
jgi:hypothetical protein